MLGTAQFGLDHYGINNRVGKPSVLDVRRIIEYFFQRGGSYFDTGQLYGESEQILGQCFRDLKNLFDALGKKYQGNGKIEMKYLSMGMTDDYEIALEEGANMLRIGRAIFA